MDSHQDMRPSAIGIIIRYSHPQMAHRQMGAQELSGTNGAQEPRAFSLQ